MSRAADIEHVKRVGTRIKTGHLDVRIAPSTLPYARVGIVVPKYKQHIVDRNRLRRRLRELVRLKLLPLLARHVHPHDVAEDIAKDVAADTSLGRAHDVLIRPFPHAYSAPFATLAREIELLTTSIVRHLT